MSNINNFISILDHVSGVIRYNMTNDFMFKSVLQRNNHVLIRLLCSLLHLDETDIHSAVVTNPIKPGDTIDAKTVILDVHILMNDKTQVNLEMQVTNYQNWIDRSTYYLCRNFTTLKKGEDYKSTKPSYQIGFLDYTLFPDAPEFYATYLLMNRRTHQVYNDKLRLSVVCLSEIDLATEEDRRYQVDVWARLFKATTWEELKMLSANDSIFQEAGATMYEISEDERMQQILEAREDARRNESSLREYYMQEVKRELQGFIDEAIAERDAAQSERDAAQSERDAAQSERDAAQSERDAAIAENQELSSELDTAITKQNELQKMLENYQKKFGPLE